MWAYDARAVKIRMELSLGSMEEVYEAAHDDVTRE